MSKMAFCPLGFRDLVVLLVFVAPPLCPEYTSLKEEEYVFQFRLQRFYSAENQT